MNNTVFLDASFWIIYRDEKVTEHPAARQAMAELFQQRARFVTTLPVICEVHAFFTRDQRKREQVLKDLCANPLVTIEDVTHQDQKVALEILRVQRDKNYSLCDVLSFVVMRRLKIKRAAAFDHHFRQFGEFEILP